MPVHPKKGGYQWGSHGKVYRGPGGKAKAARQGRAAHASGYRPKPEKPARPKSK